MRPRSQSIRYRLTLDPRAMQHRPVHVRVQDRSGGLQPTGFGHVQLADAFSGARCRVYFRQRLDNGMVQVFVRNFRQLK